MSAIVFYFHVHQPYRIKNYSLFSIGEDNKYFSDSNLDRLDNEAILKKVANKCYFPMNDLLYEMINTHDDFKVSFSISGVILDQFKEFAPDVLDSFKKLVDTGKVELVNETYYHSLAYMYSTEEFREQVIMHKNKIKELFGYDTIAFRNTELIYDNSIAAEVESMGFSTILAEGVDRYLGWRSPNFVYQPIGTEKIKLLLKNYKLSDDIAFRFSSRDWDEWPLTAEKYAGWINAVNGNGSVVNLFMDYETFGEHQWEDTGIFNFMRQLPLEIKKHPDNTFMTVSEASHSFPVMDTVDMPELTSWADIERDLSAWMSNPMQYNALSTLYNMEEDVKKINNQQLLEAWRKLSVSDHFYYMCTKWFADGDVHKYFSPNESPHEAYKHYMTILHDLRQRVYAESEKETVHA
jgi:alpha-amylase